MSLFCCYVVSRFHRVHSLVLDGFTAGELHENFVRETQFSLGELATVRLCDIMFKRCGPTDCGKRHGRGTINLSRSEPTVSIDDDATQPFSHGSGEEEFIASPILSEDHLKLFKLRVVDKKFYLSGPHKGKKSLMRAEK